MGNILQKSWPGLQARGELGGAALLLGIPRISRNAQGFPGISMDFLECPGIFRDFQAPGLGSVHRYSTSLTLHCTVGYIALNCRLGKSGDNGKYYCANKIILFFLGAFYQGLYFVARS